MRNLLVAAALLVFPVSAGADHLDVIEISLNEGCTLQKYVAIKDDFNAQWGKQNGYHAELSVPIQSQNLTPIFWVGRTANAAAFGKAWDTWRNALNDSGSVPAKLNVRFTECAQNVNRSGYDVY